MSSTNLILLIVACIIFGIIILVAIIKSSTLKRYNRQAKFGYKAEKFQAQTTNVPIINKILTLNPGFLQNEIEKTNLAVSNRKDPITGQPISLEETYKRYPEESVRLETYYRCLKQFGRDRVELEFPLQVGSKKCFLDVAVFNGDKNNPKVSQDHTALNLKFIFECKKPHGNSNNKDKYGNPETTSSLLKTGLAQLKSYMAVCPNLVERTTRDANGTEVTKVLGLGCLTNGSTTVWYKKTNNSETGNVEFHKVSGPKWY